MKKSIILLITLLVLASCSKHDVASHNIKKDPKVKILREFPGAMMIKPLS